VTCRDVIEFLMDYCDGTLDPHERGLFDAHLSLCPDCVAYLKNYEQTLHLEQRAFDAPAAPIPPKLVQAIRAARKRQS
jgi:anti-sigma factor RsiW